MELCGCICVYIAMEMYVLSKLSDYLQRCVSIWPFFVKEMEFCKESITHLNMSAKREHRK